MNIEHNLQKGLVLAPLHERPHGVKQIIREALLTRLIEGKYSSDGGTVYTTHVRTGKLRGMEIAANSESVRYALGLYEPEVTRSMRRFVAQGNTVIDIGANVGYLTMYLSALAGKSGKVISFEPFPENIRILKGNIQQNGVTNVVVEPCAVSNVNHEVPFVLGSSPVVHHIGHIGEDSDQFVPAVTLDTYMEGHSVKRPSFIKIDVEGEEEFVFVGGYNTLDRHRPVVVAEIRSQYMPAIGTMMKRLGYSQRMISNPRGAPARNGTPNFLFVPHILPLDTINLLQ